MKKKYVMNWSLGLLLLSFLVVAGPILAYSFSLGPAPQGTGDLTVVGPTTIDLPPDGILRYRFVNISSGATLKFNRNAHNTPVTFLVYSSITVNHGGTIDVSSGTASYYVSSGGPGGGDGGYVPIGANSRGKGPGGGCGGAESDPYGGGGGGGFGTQGGGGSNGTPGGFIYGNDNLVPLVGGSGGGGSWKDPSGWPMVFGGGGGGAILIAATDTITMSGQILANGGSGRDGVSENNYNGSGGGSGGAVKLVASIIKSELPSTAFITANGGNGGGYNNTGGSGGDGRIVLSCITLNGEVYTQPQYKRTYPADTLYPTNTATLTISSISGTPVSNPQGSTSNPDTVLYGTTNPVHVYVNAANIPPGSTVTVTATPQTNNNPAQTYTGMLNGTNESSVVDVIINLDPSTPTILMASVTYTITALMGDTPVYADGERVKSVRVTSRMGSKGSTMTYITESGREVLARLY